MLELRNCTLVDGRRNMTIRSKNGSISSIGSVSGWPDFIDVHGLTIIPGLIDVHVHDRTPDTNTSEDWQHLPLAAAYGGVTFVCKMPNTTPAICTAELLDLSCRQSGTQLLPHKVWFGATPDNRREIELIAQDTRVAGVKMYMGSSTGDLLVHQKKDQLHIFELCARLGLTVVVHAEDEEMLRQNQQLLERQPLLTDHCLIRSTEVETSAVQHGLWLAKVTGCRVHFAHISTPESIQLIRDVRDEGVYATVGVCPHHLVLNSSFMERPHGGLYKMNPPLRSVGQMQLLEKYVWRSGFVDVIESDHAPHSWERKTNGTNIPSGVPGIATILPLMLGGVQQQEDQAGALAHMVELCCVNPARLAGLTKKGQVVEGFDADLVAIDVAGTTTLGAEAKIYKCGWTPFDGMLAGSLPLLVISGGRIALNRLQLAA